MFKKLICILLLLPALALAAEFVEGKDFKLKNCIWGLITIWHNMVCVQFLFLKITPPYCKFTLKARRGKDKFYTGKTRQCVSQCSVGLQDVCVSAVSDSTVC